MRILIALLVMCATLFVSSAAAQEESFNNRFPNPPKRYIQETLMPVYGQDFAELLFGCHPNDNPCVIQDNIGGDELLYYLGGLAARHSERTFWIAGQCSSGCTVFADIARAKVCLTANAELGFHMGTEWHWIKGAYRPTKHFIPVYEPDVYRLAMAYGGFPVDGATYVKAKDAIHIWPMCKEHNSVKSVAVTR